MDALNKKNGLTDLVGKKQREFPFLLSKKQFLPIRQWDEQDRPRERFLSGKINEMPDEELLSILIGCGTETYSALDIAKQIIDHFNGNLMDLSCRSAKELIRKFSGIGQARAVSILAGMELGKRSFLSPKIQPPSINSSEKAFHFLYQDLAFSPYERFFVLLLSHSGKLIRKVLISEGGIASTTVDARKIFKFAIDENCSGLILAHNHPSGNLNPSPEDISITRKLSEGAKLLDLHIFDHLIICGKNYFSFSDEGLVLGNLRSNPDKLIVKTRY